MNKQFTCRRAVEEDSDLYFEWANDNDVRTQSYNSKPISYESHVKWFKENINSPDFHFYLFEDQSIPAGQVRIQKSDTDNYIIGISVDKTARGKGYAASFIDMAVRSFFKEQTDARQITAYIKKENTSSFKAFTKAGFVLDCMVLYKEYESYKLIKKNNENR